MSAEKKESGRFLVMGNRLIVTPRFDPRYQRGAEGELLTTIEGMLEERQDGTLVLDLHNCTSLPSMLLGIIMEAHRRVSTVGKNLSLLIRPEHLKSLQWVGLQRVFDEVGPQTDENDIGYIEFISKQPSNDKS